MTQRRRRRPPRDLREARNAATEEDDMQLGVEQALGWGGWLWHHDQHATLPSGTYAVSHSGQSGWPDIVALHPGRRLLLVLELKSEQGSYRPGQEDWLDAWRAVGADVRVVRPDDLHALQVELLGDRLAKAVNRRRVGALEATP